MMMMTILTAMMLDREKGRDQQNIDAVWNDGQTVMCVVTIHISFVILISRLLITIYYTNDNGEMTK